MLDIQIQDCLLFSLCSQLEVFPMVSKSLLVVGYFCFFFSYGLLASGTNYRVQGHTNLNSHACPNIIQLPNFKAGIFSVDSGSTLSKIQSVLARENVDDGNDEIKREGCKARSNADSILENIAKDLNRMRSLHEWLVERKKGRMREEGVRSRKSRRRTEGGETSNIVRFQEGLIFSFTTLIVEKEKPVDTFYYVKIKTVIVGGEELDIPEETWNISSDGAGGAIVDSGTTLSYFAEPAYKIIKEAFVEKVKGYPVVKDFPIMDPCYNVSGVEKPELPSFGLVFGDGAVWNFPVENYFIRLEPENVVCLAILGTPRSSLSIIGNYQQQNFHIIYDLKRSRLGFAPRNCAEM